MMNHKLKILGAIMAGFGALQATLPALQEHLSPMGYAAITLAVGLAVTILGRLRDVTGGFLYSNKTTILGVLTIVFAAVQGVAAQFQMFLSPVQFTLFSIFIGVALAVLGILNSTDEEA